MATTVGDLINQAQRVTNRVDSAFRTRVLESIDRALQHYADRVPWPQLERVEDFIADGSAFLVLPSRVRVVDSIGDKTNQAFVQPSAHFERQFPSYVLGTRTTGQPLYWRAVAPAAVVSSPPGGLSYVTVETTASYALDVHLAGLAQDTTASGTALEFYHAQETVAANLTPATSVNLWKELTVIEKATDDVDVIVKYPSTGVLASRLFQANRVAQYPRVEFVHAPTAGTVLQVRYYASVPKVAAETTVIPQGVDTDVLLWRAVGDLHWMYETPEAARAAWSKADEMIQQKLLGRIGHGENMQQAIPFNPGADTYREEYW